MNPFFSQRKINVKSQRSSKKNLSKETPFKRHKKSPDKSPNCDRLSPNPPMHPSDINGASLFRQETFNVCLVNARSVISDKKGQDFKSFIEESDFPLVAVTETWMPHSAATDPSFGPVIPKYSWVGQVGRANKLGGGVAWCVHDDIFQKVSVVDTELPLSNDYQISHIKLDELNIICAYVVPGMRNGNHEAVFDYMAQFNDKNAIFLGDFNLPDVDFTAGTASNARASAVYDYFCANVTSQQLVQTPTRGNNILDLVFCSAPDIVDEVQVLHNTHILYGWDHRPVQLSLTRYIETENDFKVSIKEMKKMNMKLFLQTLRNSDWSGDAANGLQIKIRENLQNAIEVAIPTREVSIRKLMKERHVSREQRAAAKLAVKLRKIYEHCPSITNYNNYLDVNALKRALQRRDDGNYASLKVTKDPKTFWNFVKRASNKHRGIPTLVHEGQKIEDDQGKADLLADGFMGVYKDRLPFTGPFWPSDPNTILMPDFSFTVSKTKKAIKSMKSSSTPGIDGIGAKFYKFAIDIIAEPLTRLFQISYDTGVVPREWLESTITALYKNKGQRNSKGSYRPISLLLVSFKLMEKCMKFDLCDFMDKNNLWATCQHAFRSRRSTLTCLLEATEQVERWLDEPDTMYIAYVSLDAMKAFDAVTFEALGRSLIDQGLPIKGVQWFLQGLSNRRFRVKVGGAYSDFQAPSSGIQQGSILSPIAWNLHMQSLQAIIKSVPEASQVCKLHIYADDICLSFRIKQPQDELILQQVLNKYEEVAQAKSMHVHPEKSQILRIGKRSNTKFFIGGKSIPEVDHLEALGVVLSANNRNDAHFQKVLGKVRQRVFLLRKTVQAEDVAVRTVVWDLMMGSVIRYGYPAIKEFNLTQIRKLQSLQRLWMSRARKCPPSCFHRRRDRIGIGVNANADVTPVSSALICPKHVGPTTVHRTLLQEDIMTFFDLCTGKMNADVPLPAMKTHNISTRANAPGGLLSQPPLTRTNPARRKSFCHRIVKLINALPVELRAGLADIRDYRARAPSPSCTSLTHYDANKNKTAPPQIEWLDVAFSTKQFLSLSESDTLLMTRRRNDMSFNHLDLAVHPGPPATMLRPTPIGNSTGKTPPISKANYGSDLSSLPLSGLQNRLVLRAPLGVRETLDSALTTNISVSRIITHNPTPDTSDNCLIDDKSLPANYRLVPSHGSLINQSATTVIKSLRVNKNLTAELSQFDHDLSTSGTVQTPLAERPKLLSRATFKRVLRSDSIFSAPEAFDRGRYKPNFTSQDSDFILGELNFERLLLGKPSIPPVRPQRGSFL